MQNTRILRYIILFIAVAAAVFDLLFFLKAYQYPGTVGKNDMIYGYWTLPVAIVFTVLIRLSKQSTEVTIDNQIHN